VLDVEAVGFDEVYEIKKGDTLGKIAKTMAQPGKKYFT
jgi:hypothetical protein